MHRSAFDYLCFGLNDGWIWLILNSSFRNVFAVVVVLCNLMTAIVFVASCRTCGGQTSSSGSGLCDDGTVYVEIRPKNGKLDKTIARTREVTNSGTSFLVAQAASTFLHLWLFLYVNEGVLDHHLVSLWSAFVMIVLLLIYTSMVAATVALIYTFYCVFKSIIDFLRRNPSYWKRKRTKEKLRVLQKTGYVPNASKPFEERIQVSTSV